MIVVTGDPHTKLLLHGNSFIDGGNDKRVITNNGVIISTAQSKFGGSSFYFDGSAYLTAPGYNFGAEDFTIDWWEYATSSNAGTRFASNFCETYSTQAGGILLHVNEDGLRVYASSATNGNWNLLSYQVSGSNILNQWVHRAAVRSGNTLFLFINGTLEYSYTLSGSIGYNSALPMCIGGWAVDAPGSGYLFTGYIDEFRVSNVARWTNNFTPPTEPYPNSSIEILPGGTLPMQNALRRRMMINVSKGLPISGLSLGTLLRIADSDGGQGDANYEIADINNFVSGGVVLVRKNIHSKSVFGSSTSYPSGTLDNKMTSIYNGLPEKLRSKIMDATFALEGSGSITRKVFALTYTMAGFGANNGTAEGKALQRYNNYANRVKNYNGSADIWLLSSRDDRSYIHVVDTYGSGNTSSYPYYSNGVVPAFVISGNTAYEPTPNTDSSYNLVL